MRRLIRWVLFDGGKPIYKHGRHLLRHKWYVFLECVRLGIPLQGILHDLSKLTPAEFLPYTEHFYAGEKPPSEMSPEMKVAWLHHIHCNPHHWDAWLLPKEDGYDVLEMPLRYRKEMLADWFGFDRAIGGSGDIREFYRRTMEKRVLGLETQRWVEDQISMRCGPL